MGGEGGVENSLVLEGTGQCFSDSVPRRIRTK